MESGGGQRRRTSIYHGQRGSGIQIQLGMQCIITDNESQSQVTMSGGHSHNSVTPPARCCLGWCGHDAGQKQTQTRPLCTILAAAIIPTRRVDTETQTDEAMRHTGVSI